MSTWQPVFLQVLPSWKVNLSGSLSLKFRTNEKNGLLLYNGGGGRDQVRTFYYLYQVHL